MSQPDAKPTPTAADEQVWDAAPQLRRPGRFLRAMRQDVLASRELAWRLLVRNLSSRYRQTLFGYLWAVLPPLVTTGVFVLLQRQNLLSVEDTGVPYALYALTGSIIWQNLADAVQGPARVLSESRQLLVKINFPREALLLTVLGEVLVSAAIRAVIWLAIVLAMGHPPAATLPLAIVGSLVAILFGLVVGTLITPLSILYRDVEYALPLVLTVWLLLTPALYPPPTGGLLAAVVRFNPAAPLIVTTRQWAIMGSAETVAPFLLVSLATAALLALGWLIYRLAMPILIERLPS